MKYVIAVKIKGHEAELFEFPSNEARAAFIASIDKMDSVESWATADMEEKDDE